MILAIVTYFDKKGIADLVIEIICPEVEVQLLKPTYQRRIKGRRALVDALGLDLPLG